MQSSVLTILTAGSTFGPRDGKPASVAANSRFILIVEQYVFFANLRQKLTSGICGKLLARVQKSRGVGDAVFSCIFLLASLNCGANIARRSEQC